MHGKRESEVPNYVSRGAGIYDLSKKEFSQLNTYRCMLQELELCMGSSYVMLDETTVLHNKISSIFSNARIAITRDGSTPDIPQYIPSYKFMCERKKE